MFERHVEHIVLGDTWQTATLDGTNITLHFLKFPPDQLGAERYSPLILQFVIKRSVHLLPILSLQWQIVMWKSTI